MMPTTGTDGHSPPSTRKQQTSRCSGWVSSGLFHDSQRSPPFLESRLQAEGLTTAAPRLQQLPACRSAAPSLQQLPACRAMQAYNQGSPCLGCPKFLCKCPLLNSCQKQAVRAWGGQQCSRLDSTLKVKEVSPEKSSVSPN